MFKSRRHSQPVVSPLPPPSPASTSPASSFNGQYPPNQAQMQQQNRNRLSVPPTSDLRRLSTGGTNGSGSFDTASINSKGEKRRSGFFGFGKKDKDKKEDKSSDQARSSFSIDRTATSGPIPPNRQANPEPAFTRPDMPGRWPGSNPSPPPGQPRVVSGPQASRPDSEFGGAPNNVPRSQSMNTRQGGPYPAPNGQQRNGTSSPPINPSAGPDRQGQNGFPRSQSMPIKQPPRPGGTALSAEKELQAVPALHQLIFGGGARMKQFDAIVQLMADQPMKTYVASPPELEMILARTSAGGQPKQGQPGSATNDWDSVWLQLSGISLSMWSMKETRAAAAKGDKVPPTYFNITDSSLELLAPLPPPPHRPNSHPHKFVFSLNTAGSNRLLFSCPSERDLARWVTGLRLAAWERARLEEIYTGHLIISSGREPPCTLDRGRMEGWVRVRVMGGTDWKRLWAVISTPTPAEDKEDDKKHKRRSFFGLGEKEKEVVQEPNTGVSMASFYTEQRTPKNKTSPAVLTITNITQAYAVFPERLEVMAQSNLMKVVGRISGELVTIENRLRDSGWALIMPEAPEAAGSGPAPTISPLGNMMRWVTGFHDVFGLYGRPDRYKWLPTDPESLFFAYPMGEERGNLFLTLDSALQSDFRTSNLPAIRGQYGAILRQKVSQTRGLYSPDGRNSPRGAGDRDDSSFRQPPLQFNGEPSPLSRDDDGPRSLTPITEQSDLGSRTNSQRTANSNMRAERRHSDARQTSVSSTKPTAEDRLAPISDSSEMLGPTTEEPVEDVHPTPTTSESATAPTVWSQSSGATPTADLSRNGSLQQQPRPFQTLVSPSYGGNDQDRGLPDLPSQASPVETTPRLSAAPVLAAAIPIKSETEQTVRKSPPTPVPDLSTPNLQSTPRPAPVDKEVRSEVGIAPIHAPTPRRSSTPPPRNLLQDEPAAMYLMNMADEPKEHKSVVTPEAQNRVVSGGAPAPPAGLAAPEHQPRNSPSPERVRPTIVTQFDNNNRSNLEVLGRKPSGARAPPPKKGSTLSPRVLDSIDEPTTANGSAVPAAAAAGVGALAAGTIAVGAASAAGTSTSSHSQVPETHSVIPASAEGEQQKTRNPSTATTTDLGDDAAQFVAYAEAPPSPVKPAAPPIKETKSRSPVEEEIGSSFAPSKAATERRAKAEAAITQQQRAMNLPGGGKRAVTHNTWSGSEDDDEVDEQEEPDSPIVEARGVRPGVSLAPESSTPQSATQARALPPLPQNNGGDARASFQEQREQYPRDKQYSAAPAPTERPVSFAPSAPPRQFSPSVQASYAQPPAQRTSMWNANFALDHGMDQTRSGKFVDLDEGPAHLTKSFAPQGLMQAGIQDKEERSAKKQEELARETGSSLINVPSKPPPPQAGLLGAVAAHEKERQNAGGIGATYTDREREKRFAEERQREIEKLQRQQMEHMSKYGGEGMGQGYNPYGYGMPMMPMGFNPYQFQGAGGYNPYAQQQAMMAAQMAYHQTMMSMSQAGSQAGDVPQGAYPERQASPVSGSGHGHHSPSPPIPPFGGYYPGGMPFPPWGGMGMPWGAPSPVASAAGGPSSPWLQPPNMQTNGSQSGSEGRSRVQSMHSDAGAHVS